MKIHLLNLSSAMLLALTLGCADEKSVEPVPDQPASGARSVSVAKVVLRPMTGSISASGVLIAHEEASVGSELSGFRVAEVFFEEGGQVKQGDILVELDPGFLPEKIAQAKAALAQADAQARQARSQAKRVAGLDGSGVVSDEQIETRRSQSASAVAAVDIAKAQLNDFLAQEKRLAIRAPVAGLILERNVRPGDIASPSQTLFRIARDGQIELDAEVPESRLANLMLGDTAAVTLSSGVELEGHIRLISPRVDAQTKLGRVRVALPAHAELRPGGYAHAIFVRETASVPAVPEKAVQFEASGPMLIVLDDENHARHLPITTTTRAGGYVAIVDGPEVGTRVALGGGAFLLDGDLVDPIAAPQEP